MPDNEKLISYLQLSGESYKIYDPDAYHGTLPELENPIQFKGIISSYDELPQDNGDLTGTIYDEDTPEVGDLWIIRADSSEYLLTKITPAEETGDYGEDPSLLYYTWELIGNTSLEIDYSTFDHAHTYTKTTVTSNPIYLKATETKESIVVPTIAPVSASVLSDITPIEVTAVTSVSAPSGVSGSSSYEESTRTLSITFNNVVTSVTAPTGKVVGSITKSNKSVLESVGTDTNTISVLTGASIVAADSASGIKSGETVTASTTNAQTSRWKHPGSEEGDATE